MVSAHTWVIALLDAVGSRPRGWERRQCPAHRDPSPSLSIGVGEDDQVLLYCHAGCATEAVLAALGMTFADLRRAPALAPAEHVHARRLALRFPPPAAGDARPGGPHRRGLRLESRHRYADHVLERWRNPRTGAKELYWSTDNGDGVLIPGLRDPDGEKVRTADLPLYLERDIRMAVAADETVVVVESESSVDALVRAGVTATTWAGGAAGPNLIRLMQVLGGAAVLLVPDHDPAGLECARLIWRALEPLTARLECVLPAPGRDARDLLAAEGPGIFRL